MGIPVLGVAESGNPNPANAGTASPEISRLSPRVPSERFSLPRPRFRYGSFARFGFVLHLLQDMLTHFLELLVSCLPPRFRFCAKPTARVLLLTQTPPWWLVFKGKRLQLGQTSLSLGSNRSRLCGVACFALWSGSGVEASAVFAGSCAEQKRISMSQSGEPHFWSSGGQGEISHKIMGSPIRKA